MKNTACIFILFLFSLRSGGQSMYGIFTGAGFATTVKSQVTPTYGLEYLVSPFRHIYMGGDFFFENYNFTHDDNIAAQFGGPGYIIAQNSTYYYLTPKIDMGIGPNEIFHGFITGGFGFLGSGQQSNELNPAESVMKGIYTGQYNFTGNTSRNIKTTLFRFSMGATEHVTVLDGWDIVFSEEFCIIPTWMSRNTYGYAGDQTMDIKTNYMCIKAGVIHKRNWEPLKPLRTWGGY